MIRRSPRLYLGFGALAAVGALTLVLTIWPGGEPANTPGRGGGDPVAADVPLPASDYPVPANAIMVSPTGDDSARGTVDMPMRTVAAAVGRAPSGATIVVREGTYRETVGKVSKSITLQPYPGEHVWMKGSLVVTGWSPSGKAWRHDGWTPNLCQNCFTPLIIDPAHPLAGSPDMVFLNGKPLRQVDSVGKLGHGTFFVDRPGKALLVGDDPTAQQLEATTFDHLLQFDSDNAAGSVFRGIGVAQYGSNQDYGRQGAMVVVNAPDVTIENATFAWSASSGAAVFKPGGKVTGSAFRNNGLVGMVANLADDLRLTGNTFTANNQEHFALTGEAIGAGGAKVTRTRHPFVANNKFVDNIGNGWWCDLGCTDATVIRNIATGNAVNGLYYEVSSRALIASNVMAHNGARGLKISSADHVGVYHNTFFDNTVSLGLYNDKRGPESDPYSAQSGLPWRVSDTMVINNFYAQSLAAQPIVQSEDYKTAADSNPQFVSSDDGNAYLRQPGDTPLISWCPGGGRATSYASLREFSQATGHDVHGLESGLASSPFTDSPHGDYTLRAGAPGVKAGRPLPADVAAVLGVLPVSNPDIGILS